MKIHELKIKENYYNDIKKGIKTFELRRNDRDFQVGDMILFKVVDDNENIIKEDNEYHLITYVLKDVEEYGLDKDYCILGI